jgi:hypothetical protein
MTKNFFIKRREGRIGEFLLNEGQFLLSLQICHIETNHFWNYLIFYLCRYEIQTKLPLQKRPYAKIIIFDKNSTCFFWRKSSHLKIVTKNNILFKVKNTPLLTTCLFSSRKM